ncbi:hypothetical protein PBRA_003489 [Plasmodiophora brassicae]|uniref:C2H2-type domain-containing protein n=1 Tax=Plasmodiophora brassicae TaxID=37360 RepID=A0A0G4J8M7_PLABS|nr:hypothetical protein PBRA_003489 [Plasmodiophora brassicae]
MSAECIARIRELSALLSEGVLTDDEFRSMKQAIIGELRRGDQPTASWLCPDKDNALQLASPDPASKAEAKAEPQRASPSISSGASNSSATRISQSSLHKFFGAGLLKSKTSGNIFVSPRCPDFVDDVLTCTTCKKRCKTGQAYIQHVRLHRPKKDKDAEMDDNGQKPPRRGSDKRRRFDFAFKASILDELAEVEQQTKRSGKKFRVSVAVDDIATSSGLSASTVMRWVKSEKHIRSKAADTEGATRKTAFSRFWLPSLRQLEERVAREVRQRRRKGYKVNKCWVIRQARMIRNMPGVVDPSHASSINLSKSWYYSGFIERHGFSIKRSNNRKKCDASAHKPVIFQFHQQLWEQHETKPIPPSSLFNFDQVPLPFVCERDKRTLDDKGSERVWVRQPGPGLEKRQATLHLTMCADSNAMQPKPVVIFRGLGNRIMNSDEVSRWDPRVTVLFQKHAWVDADTAIKIVRGYGEDPAFAAEDSDRTFLCDNLDAHKDPRFQSAISPLGRLMYFPPNVTDLLQPVDRR